MIIKNINILIYQSTNKFEKVWSIRMKLHNFLTSYAQFEEQLQEPSNVQFPSLTWHHLLWPEETASHHSKYKIRNFKDNDTKERKIVFLPAQQLSSMHQSLQVWCIPCYPQGCLPPEYIAQHQIKHTQANTQQFSMRKNEVPLCPYAQFYSREDIPVPIKVVLYTFLQPVF